MKEDHRTRVILSLLLLAIVVMGVCASNRAWWDGFVGAAMMAGGLVFVLWRWGRFSMKTVLVMAVVFRLCVIWLPPSLSDDAYRYVWDGMIQMEGINPYAYVPADTVLARFHDETVFTNSNSKTYFSIYPPLSQVYFAAGGLFYRFGWRVSYFVIKVLLLLSELTALFFLSRIVKARMLILYAWNPLVVIETAGQLHTEAIMVLGVVLTVYLARREQGGWASVALAAAGWVKLYPFVFFPLLWRRFRWKAVWPPLIFSIVLLAPYFHSWVPAHFAASLNLYVRYFEFDAGLYYGVKELFLFATGDDWSKTLGPAFRLIFLAALPVIYLVDGRRKWPLYRSLLWIMGVFFLFSTTIHPWYILGLLSITLLSPRPPWHWFWLGLISMGTYLLYVGGPYWVFVNIGWIGWAIIATWNHKDRFLQGIQRLRARQKFERIRAYFPPGENCRVLDLGAGEGYVGAAVAGALGATVELADVVDMNRTTLPHTVYDGQKLPFSDDTFDVTILYFVLHHCGHQEAVLRESRRVTQGRVIVVESVYEKRWDLRLLTALDTLANRLRSGGLMNKQEVHLLFRKASDWRTIFQDLGFEVLAQERKGRWIHKQQLFLLRTDKGQENG